MIKKEVIKQRRQEIAEVRHADSVYRDIIARENEREDYEKRWFWELLQNAKDSVEGKERIKVKVEITDDMVSFSHSGSPFELDDILSLIVQGSSKNNQEGKIGRFGTGFITTYLLSKEVYITGKLLNNGGCFHFLLNRNARDNKHFYCLQRKSNEQFDESIREQSYLGDDEFQTQFVYTLDEKGKETARKGLENLDELIPITQLFNEQIDSVIVIQNGETKTFFKSNLQIYEQENIHEFKISSVIENKEFLSLKAFLHKGNKYDACIITHNVDGNETILPFTESHPRLYFTFPLIGTEEIEIPLIINSNNFDPRVERDGVYLKKESNKENESINKEIIEETLLNSLPLFAKLFNEKKINGIHELFNLGESKDLKWIDNTWFNEVKNSSFSVLSTLAIIPNNQLNKNVCLNEFIIPCSDKGVTTKGLWELLCNINVLKVPKSEEDLNNWVKVIKKNSTIQPGIYNEYNLNNVWGINELIDFVEGYNSLEELSLVISEDCILWLNQFYALIINIKETFPLEKKIALNQRNVFRKAEGMYWDEFKDETLKSISDLLKLNFPDNLFPLQVNIIHISSIESFLLEEAINKIKSKLNNLTERDFNYNDYQKGSALFLKWLIINDKKEVIADLKVLTGESKKSDESFIYSHFPKTEHLLLTPKVFFEREFPLYAILIRDKDCLNEVYNQYLDSDEYNYLNINGFIHLKPFVIKEDFASIKLLEYLVIDENDLNTLRDNEGQLKYKFKIRYTDFAYLTTSDGHIYARNNSKKSSFERFDFLINEAVEKDPFFDEDIQEIKIDKLGKSIFLRLCLWVYRAKKLNWVNIKNENSDNKFVAETPSSKNLSDLIKDDQSHTKTIRGAKQQLFLNKLNVGVSDLIRNTLPNDELRISWDKAITNMITSNVNPQLVEEIFNDPYIQKEYENRLNARNLITRNQKIGALIEKLFNDYIGQLNKSGEPINIRRKPFGSDYILTEESSDLVNENNEQEIFKINGWLIELKATGKKYASMTPLQVKTATEHKENYAVVIVPLQGVAPDIEYLKQNAKVISNIGERMNNRFTDFNEVELKKNKLSLEEEGISVNIEDSNIRFKVRSTIWEEVGINIETFIKNVISKIKTN